MSIYTIQWRQLGGCAKGVGVTSACLNNRNSVFLPLLVKSSDSVFASTCEEFRQVYRQFYSFGHARDRFCSRPDDRGVVKMNVQMCS